MSQRTSKYMYRQRKEKNLYQATRNVDKLVVNNLQSETVDELVSASLLHDGRAPSRLCAPSRSHSLVRLPRRR